MLYIPHGSDERFCEFTFVMITSFLYIPHGSDESDSTDTSYTQFSYFISHMVQMKDYLIHFKNQ